MLEIISSSHNKLFSLLWKLFWVSWKLKGLAKLVFIYVKTNFASHFSFQLTQIGFHKNEKSLLWLENKENGRRLFYQIILTIFFTNLRVNDTSWEKNFACQVKTEKDQLDFSCINFPHSQVTTYTYFSYPKKISKSVKILLALIIFFQNECW